jgi:hypothetical protein
MIRPRTAGLAGILTLSVAVLLAACAGSTGSATSSGPAATGAASLPAVTTPPAASSGAGASADAGASGPAIAIPSFDIGALTNNLANVDSYRVSISINDAEQFNGVVVTKPELARDLTMKDGTRIVVIGDEAWMGKSGGPLNAVPGALATAMFSAFDPTLLVAAYSGPQWARSSLDKGKETKNGVEATHYHIDSSTAAAGFSGIPSGANIDLWISDAGVLVALEASGFPNGSMSIQVTGIDDPANKVERPS